MQDDNLNGKALTKHKTTKGVNGDRKRIIDYKKYDREDH